MSSQQSSAPEWSAQYQRWLIRRWHPQYSRWYWAHHVDGQGWVYFDWIAEAPTPQVAPQSQPQYQQQYQQQQQYPQHQQYPQQNLSHVSPTQQIAGPNRVDSALAGAVEIRHEGPTITGTYNSHFPEPDSHYERLDRSFYVRESTFYVPGRVFAVLFTEPAGSTATRYNSSISEVKFGEKVFSQIRRFIVVRQRREFCYVVPVFTYGGQATTKPGVDPNQHAIAYSYGSQPTHVQGETTLVKEPICIVMHEGESPLAIESRIYFGITHPIQYNIRMKDIGHVIPDDLDKLLGYWAMENERR